MIDLSRTVFVMDGPSDIKSFTGKIQKEYGEQSQFRKAPCNGHTVSAEGYANGVHGTVNFALNSNFLHILCVLDREKRKVSAEKLAETIRNELVLLIEKSSNISTEELNEKLKVIVADRMLENWIIADVEGIKEKKDLINEEAIQDNYDGQSGVNILKKFMLTKYDKVQHAPILFKKVSIERAVQNSPSFNSFIEAIEA